MKNKRILSGISVHYGAYLSKARGEKGALRQQERRDAEKAGRAPKGREKAFLFCRG